MTIGSHLGTLTDTWMFAAAAVTPPESVAPMSRISPPPGAAALRQITASVARKRADGSTPASTTP